jgi:acetolactate synthase-1/2/3 large subunit
MKIDPAYRTDFAALKRTARSDFLATLGAYGSFPEQLRQVMPTDAIWVRDVTQSNTTWGDRIFPVYGPHQSVLPVGAGIVEADMTSVGECPAHYPFNQRPAA